MLKWGSSTQTGRPSWSGTNWTTWRYLGTRESRPDSIDTKST